MAVAQSSPVSISFLGDGSEMAERIRAHDWASTSLGPIEAWPQSLRTVIDLMLTSPGPTSVMWGPERVQLYNDAYVPIAGERHPEALGRRTAENWSDAYDSFLGPVLDRVFAGEAVRVDEHPVPLRASCGGLKERVFTGSFQPVRDEDYQYRVNVVGTQAVLDAMTAELLTIYGKLPLLYAGGVMSNVLIREQMQRKYGGIFAQPQYSSDNSAGIAVLASLSEEAADE